MEKELGVQLIDRSLRPLRPTAVGRRLVELAVPLVEHAELVSNRIGDVSSRGAIPVRLGCADSFASTFGPEIIRGLANSDREISLWSGITANLTRQLTEGEVDVVISQNLHLPSQRFVEVPLLSEALVLVVSKKVLQRGSGDWKTIANELPLIKYSSRSALGQQVDRLSKHLGISSAQRYEFDATDAVLSLVSAQLGFAITTPLCLWQARHFLPELEMLPLPASVLARRDLTLVYRRGLWEEFSLRLRTLTVSVLAYSIRPSLAKLLPDLPEDALRAEAQSRA